MTWSFFLWIVLFVGLLVVLVRASRRGRDVVQRTEEIAQAALPEIGQIAERKHVEKFGRAPTNVPRQRGRSLSTSWYPETKRAKHHV
jgi:hypothetical protein